MDTPKKYTTKFKDGNPVGIFRTTKKISDGSTVGPKWATWLAEPGNEEKLREAYASGKMAAVMALTELAKSCAYELVAFVGLREEKVRQTEATRRETYQRRIAASRLRHLLEVYRWHPGQNYCRLYGKFFRYDHGVAIGASGIAAGRLTFVANLPRPSVRGYMEANGLRFWLTPPEVVPVDDARGAKTSLLICVPREFEAAALAAAGVVEVKNG